MGVQMNTMLSIKERAAPDRPREKLLAKGAQALSDFELLEVIIGNGTKKMRVGQIAGALQRLMRKTDARALTIDGLRSVPGISTANICRLLAMFEWMKRWKHPIAQRILRSEDVLPLVSHIRRKKQEYLMAITLDGAQTVMSVRTVSIGTLTASLIHPREIFADAISERAASIILVHNHPSGSLEPSGEDRRITEQLVEAGELLGIPVRDHLIVTHDGWCSMRSRGVRISSCVIPT